jgi:hypothetical protein
MQSPAIVPLVGMTLKAKNMHKKLQLANIILLCVYAVLMLIVTFHVRGHPAFKLILAMTSLLFGWYFMLATFVFSQNVMLAKAWVSLIRFNVYLNLFFLVLYFMVLPVLTILETSVPRVAVFINPLLDKFVIFFVGGIVILLAGNCSCFIRFIKYYLNRDNI